MSTQEPQQARQDENRQQDERRSRGVAARLHALIGQDLGPQEARLELPENLVQLLGRGRDDAVAPGAGGCGFFRTKPGNHGVSRPCIDLLGRLGSLNEAPRALGQRPAADSAQSHMQRCAPRVMAREVISLAAGRIAVQSFLGLG